ncbi:MAG TPA: FAD-dependent oxidoreductase [Roseomonas sp.]|jgi:NADPH-dependent 2,4-dienoyl-CoA reductase/sulfur reductase-like enzyme
MRRLSGVDDLRDAYDLVIIGAGPAGMAATLEAGDAGLSVLVLDENPHPGGQIWRAIGTAPLRDPAILGREYWAGSAVAEAFAASGADYLPGATVWHLDDTLEIGVSAGARSTVLPARQVIIATGAMERPFPIPGWTLPGVMTVGAGQTLLKAQGMVPAGRTLLAGSGPLLWLYAAQCIAAGAPPALILETTPRGSWRAALRHLPGFLATPYAPKGLRLMAQVRRRVRVAGGVTRLAIAAEGSALRVAWDDGGQVFDHVLLHQGVVPNINLAAAAGCAIAWDEGNACFAPVTDGWGASSIPGIALAGDGAGIAGAEAAGLRGRIAALAALRALGAIDAAARDARAAPLRRDLARWSRGRPFLDTLYKPAASFRAAAPDAIACRCEEVTGAAVRDAARMGATGPNQLKAFLRCGMGPCQGRLCGLTITETIAAERGTHPRDVGPLRLRTPAKPITLGEFAALRKTEADLDAVERR